MQWADTTTGLLKIRNASNTDWVTVGTLASTYLGLPSLASFPRGSLSGCVMSNNGADATNDIDISVGKCRDSTDAVNITVAAMTKRLDAGWAAGDNQGFRNSAAAITDTTYFIYVVATAAGVQDFYAHTSPVVATVLTALQAESGGSSYVYARRIGAILRESAAIVTFFQQGDHFYRKVPVSEWANNSTGTARVTKTIKVPVGIKVLALLTVTIADHSQAADHYGIINSPDAPDTAPTSSNYNMALIGVTAGDTSSMFTRPVLTNTSAQVTFRMSQSAADIYNWGASEGWIDNRGKDE